MLPFVRSSPPGSEGAARGGCGGERGFQGGVSRPFYLVAAGKEGGREAAAVTAGRPFLGAAPAEGRRERLRNAGLGEGGGAGCGPGESLVAGGLRGGEADGAAVFRSRSARFPARRCAGSAAAPRRSAPPLFSLSAEPRRAHRCRLRAVPSQGPGAELNFGPFAPTGGVAAP